MIKKRRYWPKHVGGDSIKGYMENKEIGTCDRLPGILDGQPFDIYALKEPDYTLMMMSTYGSLIVKDGQRDSVRVSKEDRTMKRFKYTEVVANHFKYRGAVDDHNGKRHDCGSKNGLSLESTWTTNRWENKVFSFILAITEVNAYLAQQYFTEREYKQVEFRKKLAHQLVFNTYDDAEDFRRSSRRIDRLSRARARHELITAPPHSCFVRGNWEKSTNCHTNSTTARIPIVKKGYALCAHATNLPGYVLNVSRITVWT